MKVLERNRRIRAELEALAEEKYKSFSSALIPGEDNMLGVRLPALRGMAKKLAKGDWREYLEQASDDSMEEIVLQGMTIGYVKAEFRELIPYLDAFVPKIRNWSVCDSTCNSLKIAKKEPEAVWEYLQTYLASEQEFEVRFGLVMLLSHFVNENYLERIFAWLDKIRHEGYYVKMAAAWNLAACFAEFPEETMRYLQRSAMDDWTYNKAIQKMTESYRVSGPDKERLRQMKR